MIWVLLGILMIIVPIASIFMAVIADSAREWLAMTAGMVLLMLLVAGGAALIDYGVAA